MMQPVIKAISTKRINLLLKRFTRDESGNILIIAAVALPVLLAATGLAVDVNRYMKTGSYVQSAVDQAAVAATSVDGQNRTEIATRFFNASLTEDVQQYLTLDNIAVSENFPEGGPLSVTVTADVTLKNSFAGFVGLESMQLTRTSQASRAVDRVEAVITMASGGTMCSTKKRIPNNSEIVEGDTLIALEPDKECTNFNAMKQGVRDFIKIIDSNQTISNFKIGLVPYNYKVKMPNLNAIPPSLAANEPKGFYENLTDAEPLSAVVPLTSKLTDLDKALEKMQQTPEGIAWSRSDLASHVGGLMLNPQDSNYFGGETPVPFGDASTQKIMIMMTDGANIGCCFTNWPIGNFDNQYVYSYKPYNENQLEICRILKEKGVKIFTILFDVKETDAGGKEINNIFARCASGAYDEQGVEQNADSQLLCSKKQLCFNVESTEDLIKVYQQIAQTFYKPTITQ